MRADDGLRSDGELLQASRNDAGAFGAFYDRHIVAVVGFFARRTGDTAEAADLASETFVAAYLGRHRYRDTGAPATAWLFTIARRQLSHYVRRQRVSKRYRRQLGVNAIELSDGELDEIENLIDLGRYRGKVRAALDGLPARQAEAVQLRVVEQLPYAEVARRMSCSQGAARVAVCRGLARLADSLEAM